MGGGCDCCYDFMRKKHIFVSLSICLDHLMLRKHFNPVMKLHLFLLHNLTRASLMPSVWFFEVLLILAH